MIVVGVARRPMARLAPTWTSTVVAEDRHSTWTDAAVIAREPVHRYFAAAGHALMGRLPRQENLTEGCDTTLAGTEASASWRPSCLRCLRIRVSASARPGRATKPARSAYLRMYIRLSPQACCTGFVGRSRAGVPGRCLPATAAGRPNGPRNSWRAAGAAGAAQTPDYDAADARCSKAENVANGKEQDPAVGDGYDAA